MSNIKLSGHTWDTSGIYDAAEGKTQKEVNSGLKTAITPFVEEVPYINLFDGAFDESGYIDAGVDKPSSNFKRTSKYYPIIGDNLGSIYGYTSETVNAFAINIYDANYDFIKEYGFLSSKTTGSLAIPPNAAYFRMFTRTEYSGNCTVALTPVTSYIPYHLVPELKDEIIHAENLDSDLQEHIGINESKYVYINGISTDALKGLYIPNLTGWTFYRIRCYGTWYRFGITLSDGTTVILNGLNDVGTSYSDTVQTLVNPSTGDVIGYYVLHYTGEDYDEDANVNFTPNTQYTSSLDYNPIIKEYLNREENLVLMGDSIFGYADQNQLAPILSKISKKRVFNCGFGGCTMAKMPNAQAYDPYTFAGISESIVSGDFSTQQAAISLQAAAYPYRYADLVSVDWSKPTTIFVDYINNDFAQNIPLGDPWEYTDASTDWDNTKFVEAMTYGLNKILTEYPHIRVVFFTSKWRFIANGSNVLQPPYVYENSLNLKAKDYNDALLENANRLGVSVYDFHNWGGANAFNASYYMFDGKSHFTIEGYEHFAEVLNNLDKSFIG